MPGSIAIVGLGPGDPELRTLGAVRAISEAERIVVRTAIHPAIEDVVGDPRAVTCDDLYQASESFQAVYEAIAERVVESGSRYRTVYAVPGHPRFGERSVDLVIEKATRVGLAFSVLAGVSALDVVGSSLGFDPMTDHTQLVDGVELDEWLASSPFGGTLDLTPTRPMLISQVYSREVASAVKLALSRILPDDHPVVVISAASVPGVEAITECPLHQLDRFPADHLTSVRVPALEHLDASRSATTLHRLAAILRSPGGCPWDRKQTHESLRGAVIEEAYEVVDAIDCHEPDHLAEELGDLLLQVALHAQIAEEAGEFSAEDVYDHVNRKLVRRHPHVFGDVSAPTPDDVIATWQGVKSEERRLKGEVDQEEHPFDRLPRSMPILARLARLASKNQGPATGAAPDALGDALLAEVESIIAAGYDPERELDRAVRRRMADPTV